MHQMETKKIDILNLIFFTVQLVFSTVVFDMVISVYDQYDKKGIEHF